MPTSTLTNRARRPGRLPPRGFKILLLALALLPAAAARAATVEVHAGDNLQAKLDAAQPGDVLVLDAGAVFTGQFTLPVTAASAASYITVRSSLCAELPGGVRVTPAAAPKMARLATPSVAPVLTAPVLSHHWRFECLEFTQGPAAGEWGYHLIALGDSDPEGPQQTLASVPHHFEFDRCIVRARDAGTAVQRGISLNSAHTTVKNSHIADIKQEGVETQALGGVNGPGPFLIENNYLEAAGINIIFGGAPTAVPDLVPGDIVVRRNHLYKPLSWRVGDPSFAGRRWTVKNLFELKNARRVLVEGNVMENSWAEAQTGWAVIFNALGEYGPSSVVEDVEFVNNVIRNSGNGINLRGMEPEDPATRMRRIRFSNNLMENVGAFGGEGKPYQLLHGTEAVTLDHTTVLGPVKSTALLDTTGDFKHVGCSFTNNVTPHGEFGVLSGGTGAYGKAALDERCGAGSWTFERNLVAGADPARFPNPSTNYYPPAGDWEGQFADYAGGDYRLAATSCGSAVSNCNPKGALGGKDSGVDFDELESWTAGVARANVALAARGATASASSTLDANRAPLAAINGDRRGLHWGSAPATGSGWHDATQNGFPDWLEVAFGGPKVIEQVEVFGVQNAYTNPSEPTPAMTSTLYGLTAFDVEYWTGSAWAQVPGGQVTNNDKAWRTIRFAPLTTAKIRVVAHGGGGGYSRIIEVEAWTAAVHRANHALSANGATAAASSTLDAGRAPLAAINGDRKGLHWGSGPSTGSGWHDATQNGFPDWLEVTFDGAKAISEVDLFGVQNSVSSPSEPTPAMASTLYGLTAFDVQYWDGSQWAAVPGGVVTGNNKVWRRFYFPHVWTDRIRVHVGGGVGGYSRVVEVEAY